MNRDEVRRLVAEFGDEALANTAIVPDLDFDPSWSDEDRLTRLQGVFINAFGTQRALGQHWHPQAYWLDDQGVLGTAVSPPEGELIPSFPAEMQEIFKPQHYPLWMSLWPFYSSWPEVSEMFYVADTWVTDVTTEDSERSEAMVITRIRPTRCDVSMVRYKTQPGMFMVRGDDLTEDGQLKWLPGDIGGSFNEIIGRALTMRTSGQGQPIPVWCSFAQLAAAGFSLLWSERLTDTVDPTMKVDIESIVDHLIEEIQSE